MNNMYNSPCGWSAWKLYGMYYLYLLTGKEDLVQAFNWLGACIQLMDWRSGRLRWGFTPDPFVNARWAVPADPPTRRREHD